jgi:hypothetical protein
VDGRVAEDPEEAGGVAPEDDDLLEAAALPWFGFRWLAGTGRPWRI